MTIITNLTQSPTQLRANLVTAVSEVYCIWSSRIVLLVCLYTILASQVNETTLLRKPHRSNADDETTEKGIKKIEQMGTKPHSQPSTTQTPSSQPGKPRSPSRKQAPTTTRHLSSFSPICTSSPYTPSPTPNARHPLHASNLTTSLGDEACNYQWDTPYLLSQNKVDARDVCKRKRRAETRRREAKRGD
ncbi:uncharacterized protein BDZ83DRAFT_648337 [Colletotrichum acutatum]|uniref:Uncharacterized protein n=1 Tax=Glomerella acutata TaxID=27357 RepID=A0AAD8XKF1_GLOAC|nr:uncharacterized protein BDZ83DRAFT_648337 [Colletotrichum acutatum]KAK1729005.1 hypothetical protein BDZ83DRAFT_648337 [Colletotrichum acutatum]